MDLHLIGGNGLRKLDHIVKPVFFVPLLLQGYALSLHPVVLFVPVAESYIGESGIVGNYLLESDGIHCVFIVQFYHKAPVAVVVIAAVIPDIDLVVGRGIIV